MPSARKIAVAGATGTAGQHAADVLAERGHQVVPMSRSQGVDVITGDGLAAALAGVDCVIDAATGSSPGQQAATAFFTTASRNLHEAGQRAGVRRMIVVSIIGTDRFTAGYGAAKIAHEQAHLSGPIPVRVLRAAQFHEFVAQLVECGTRGEVAYAPRMHTQLVAARAVARYSPTWPPHRKTAAFAADVAGPPLAAAAGLRAAARIAWWPSATTGSGGTTTKPASRRRCSSPPSPAPSKRW